MSNVPRHTILPLLLSELASHCVYNVCVQVCVFACAHCIYMPMCPCLHTFVCVFVLPMYVYYVSMHVCKQVLHIHTYICVCDTVVLQHYYNSAPRKNKSDVLDRKCTLMKANELDIRVLLFTHKIYAIIQ